MQQTLAQIIEFRGIGVHKGNEVHMRLCPAAAGQGIIFRRTDLPQDNEIVASYQHVVDTRMCTILANQAGAKVATIEHLMAALYGCGVDNAIVEVDADELPIQDGSAIEFMRLIETVGLKEQDIPRQTLRINKKVEVAGENGVFISIEPYEGFMVDYSIDFTHPTIGIQHFIFDESTSSFGQTIAQARTFGFMTDLEKLRSMGLALGASLDNAIGIDESGVMNQEGLRYEDEFVRHKILDCIGDLYLTGLRIKGCVHASKAGHGMHNKLLHALFSDNSNYTKSRE